MLNCIITHKSTKKYWKNTINGVVCKTDYEIQSSIKQLFLVCRNKGTIKGTGNREQRIRILTYQKLFIPQYMISDRLKFLFSVFYSPYCAELSSSFAAKYVIAMTNQNI